MGAQDGGRRHGTDLALKAFRHRLRLTGVGDNADNFPGLQYLPHRHRDRAAGHVREALEPAFPKLLPAARFVQVDHDVRRFALKVSGRIVERQVSVFADPDESHVDGRLANFSGYLGNRLPWIDFAIHQVIAGDAYPVNQPVEQIFAKTRRMRGRKANVFIQVKHFHPLPIHVGRFREFLEKLELGRSGGGNDPCAAMFTDGAAKGRGGLLGCGRGKLIFVRKNSDVHFGDLIRPA